MDNFLNIENDLLQAGVEEMEDDIPILQTLKKTYTNRQRLEPFTEFSDSEFRRRFRLPKQSVHHLYELIGESLEPLTTRPNFTISGMDKILITLRYFATASFHIVSGDFYGISESSVCTIIPKVSEKIAALRAQMIKMPSTADELEQKKMEFFRVAGMPGVIGAMDGTLVKIQEVGGQQNKTDFFSRKQFYAINTQIVCDANANVLDIVARWPGSTHDQTIFLNSSIFNRFLLGEFDRNGHHSFLLADGGYRSESFVATPLRHTTRQRTRAENLYQNAHISTRNVVERFNGQWKKRFPCLWIGMRFRKLETILNVIVATAVLHNISKLWGDNIPPPLTEDQEIQYNLAHQEMRLLPNNNNRGINVQNLPNTIANVQLRNYFENIAAQQ